MEYLIVLYFLLAFAGAALIYYLACMPQEGIARKLCDGGSWMAFVPFARNVQRMKMVDMPMWKMFFVGGIVTMSFSMVTLGLLTYLFMSLNLIFGTIMGVIMYIAYLVFYLLSSFDYYCRIAEDFRFRKVPTALVLMFVPFASQVIILLMGLSDRFYPGDAPQAAAAPAAGPVMGGAQAIPAAPVDSEVGIVGVSGMYSGAKFSMKPGDEFVIGRDSTLASIIISANGEKVSRRHCTVRFNPAICSYEVIDHSSNGTFYGNNRLIKDQITSIPRGTTIVIGDKLNQFKLL